MHVCMCTPCFYLGLLLLVFLSSWLSKAVRITENLTFGLVASMSSVKVAAMLFIVWNSLLEFNLKFQKNGFTFVSYLFISTCYDLSFTYFNELIRCKCTNVLLLSYFLGSGRGQTRILRAGTLTTALVSIRLGWGLGLLNMKGQERTQAGFL